MTPIAALLIGAAITLAVLAVGNFLVRREAGKIALAHEAIAQQQAEVQRETLSERAQAFTLRTFGYSGTLQPALLAAACSLLVMGVVGRFLGLDPFVALMIAVPFTGAAGWLALSRYVSQRRKKFNLQLQQMLDLLAGQIAAGLSLQRALEQITTSLPNPIRAELTDTLRAAGASKDLVAAMRGLGEKYPSRAFSMFLAALEIDRDMGGQIEPALRQAGASLQADFELIEEAVAEVAQARFEFYIVIAGLGWIAATVFLGADANSRAVMVSPAALIALGFGAINFGVGVWRARRIFRHAGGEA